MGDLFSYKTLLRKSTTMPMNLKPAQLKIYQQIKIRKEKEARDTSDDTVRVRESLISRRPILYRWHAPATAVRVDWEVEEPGRDELTYEVGYNLNLSKLHNYHLKRKETL